ncbi:MAG: HEAT repeat domain-containing protein [Gemmataceae bacterium]
MDQSYADHIQRMRREYAQLLFGVRSDPLAAARLKQSESMKRLLRRQLEQWLEEQKKAAGTLDALYRRLEKEDATDLIVRLKDEEPLNRWMAIQMAMRRWDKVDNFLVEMLDDPAPLVRQAAHQALVQFARGADHGPFGASPTKEQTRAAQKSWRAYLETQDAPEVESRLEARTP